MVADSNRGFNKNYVLDKEKNKRHRTCGKPLSKVDLTADVRNDLPDAFLSNLSYKELGTVVAYSNWDVALAAYVVECVSGIEYADYVHENILNCLA